MKSLFISVWVMGLFFVWSVAVYAASPFFYEAIATTQTGIFSSLTLFYVIGGAILVVCAGIWGFKRVKA